MVDTNQGQDQDFAVVENKETCQSLSQQGNIRPRFLSRLALANQKCQDCHAYITQYDSAQFSI
jgi:hypothetical protein